MLARQLFDLDAIRARHPLPDYCRKHGIELHGKANPRGSCPLHGGDNREAFSVFRKKGQWLWHCHTGDCGTGDVITLHRALRGCDFPTACRELGADSLPFDGPPAPKKAPPPPEPLPCLSREQEREMEALAETLAGDADLCAAVAHSRGWELPTVRSLACTYALGWKPEHPTLPDAAGLAFLYPHAVKMRALWPDGQGGWRWHLPDGSKRVGWLWPGWPWNSAELWREDGIGDVCRDQVLIVEGEPDCLTAINLGANTYRQTVVALPSASLGNRLRERLPQLLRGFHIRLYADADPAGQRAASALATILKPTCQSFEPIAK